MIFKESFKSRVRQGISLAWEIFIEKVGSGALNINKEASMQLHFAHILQQISPLICFRENESIDVELETSVHVKDKIREIDVVVCAKRKVEEFKIAIEMKCYKTKSSSGKNRGAQNIFMKDIYADLMLLENYCSDAEFHCGILLAMTDYEAFVYPKNKKTKAWVYDISHGTSINGIHLDTAVAGKNVEITLEKRYDFQWIRKGEYFFMESEGRHGKQNNSSKFQRLTYERLVNIIKHFNKNNIVISNHYTDGGSCSPWPRFERAVTNQIENGDATVSRYAIWANTVRDNIIEATSLLTEGKNAEAKKLLIRASNSLSAFSDIQAYFDPFD